MDIARQYHPGEDEASLKRYALSIYRHNPTLENPMQVYRGMQLVIPHHA